MTQSPAVLRAAAAAALVTLALAAPPLRAAGDALGPAQLAGLAEADASLKAARADLPDCEPGCITPGEATAMALALGEGEARAGRFLLDVRGGGQSLQGQLGTMLFVNSRRDYATLGTLTIAFEPEALHALLRRARGCGAADVVDGQITVKACYGEGVPDLNMFTMMQRLGGRRLIVEGEVRRNWIDSPLGSPRPIANFYGEHEVGYYQVWVHVTEAAQVTFADER
ncbi:hypothetical protein [Porphyrobacter sp. CACIAM 03H1]|uniref:hypothetical protein n=1 Tax=Porphyrobacter sp. CACIAM 03H1 TaxID=2003315 RepID=UPI0012FDA6DD|nr:hypothetical protein [Porphyrobacter sp. CACIAM 03H1]